MLPEFLPKEVLASHVNPYYFLWAPLGSAWHNYKIAFFQDPTVNEMKIAETAQNAMQENNQNQSGGWYTQKATHIITYAGMGLLLTVPLINLIPFSCLVIKAKEDLIPGIENETIEEKQVQDSPEISRKSQIRNPASKENKPQNKFTHKSTSTAKRQTSPRPILVKTEGGQPSDRPLTRRSTNPNFSDKMKVFQTTSSSTLLQEKPVIERNFKKIKEVKNLEAEVTTHYFVLFPEESPNPIFRKSVDKHASPIDQELSIVGKLILNSQDHRQNRTDVEGDINKPKFENAEKNIITLQYFLIGKFGEKIINCYFQRSSGYKVNILDDNHALPSEQTNPFEIVKKGIFSCPNQDFLELLTKYDYEIYDQSIRISTLDLG